MSSTASPDERPDEGGATPSDEEWAEFLRHAEDGTGRHDAPKEPSARARLVTARLRERDEAAASRGRPGGWFRRGTKRAKGHPEQAWQPDGWRTGPAWQEMNGRGRKRRSLGSAVAIVALLGVALVAVRPSLLTDRLPGHDSASGTTTPLGAETARPSSAPPGDPEFERPTVAHPFLGSPAQRWADGADGIVLPAATAVGGMSRTDVRHALSDMKKLLISANLDPATLRGERPKGALAVLDPRQKDLLNDLNTSLAKPTEEHDPLDLFSRFDPDELTLTGKVVKTRGRMTFEAGDRPGTVDVHADYTFVYPVVRVGTGADAEVARTIVRRTLSGTLYDPEKYLATSGKLSLTDYASHLYNSACSVHDGYLQPQFAGESVGIAPTGPAADPYDRSKTLASEVPGDQDTGDAACGTVTRT